MSRLGTGDLVPRDRPTSQQPTLVDSPRVEPHAREFGGTAAANCRHDVLDEGDARALLEDLDCSDPFRLVARAPFVVDVRPQRSCRPRIQAESCSFLGDVADLDDFRADDFVRALLGDARS